MQPALHRLIHVANRRLVVTSHEQLELREEVKEVLAHETCRHFVAAGDGLDLRFVPAPALLGLDRCHKARTAQACQVGRVSV